MTLEKSLSKLNAFEQFAEIYRENGGGFTLGNHQLVPIFDAVENGLRRFVLAYGTGAGKTIIPIEIIKHLQKRKENTKTLVIAPKQTFDEKNWSPEVLREHGCYVTAHNIHDKRDRIIPDNADFVTVNYDKLNPSLRYIEQLINFASQSGLVVADEFHNVRNKNAKTSQGYQAIIESSKDARFIGLSASPIYDRLSDAGMLLFSLNPTFTPDRKEGYGHYKIIPFYINQDPVALWEMREKGQIRFFDIDAVAKFHNLPRFIEQQPKQVSMPKEFADSYFKAFREVFHLGKLHNLERLAIEGLIHSSDTKEFLREKIASEYTLNFFSHLMHEPKEGTPDEAIFRQLEKLLKEVGAKDIATIRGATTETQRREIQKLMHQGRLDALINQWGCTSEGFSEIAGHRPVCIIPLRSPYSPGRFVQILGRSYRPGQKTVVEYQELHAHSEELLDKINEFVQEYAKKNDLRIKSTWEPSLFHRDAYMIRKGKEKAVMILFTQRSHHIFDQEDLEVKDSNSLTIYCKRLSQERIIDFSDRDKSDFGTGTKTVIKHVGKNYEDNLKPNIEPLGRDYNKKDILFYTPGKINLFLAEALDTIKEREEQTESSWKIADLGCCSTAPFAQARLLYQALQSLRKPNISLDYIVSVDGDGGFIRNVKTILGKKLWLDGAHELRIPGFSEEDMLKAQEKLINTDYMKNLEFLVANFTADKLPGIYDTIITSQCLQYNDQTKERDIEKIVMNVNNSLRQGGHYLTILTGNSKTSSFTSKTDVENFKFVLSSYGFEVAKYCHVAGKEDKKEVLRPFHYVHAIKSEEAPSKLITLETIPIIYCNTVERLTGGYKNQRLGMRTPPKREGRNPTVPDVYVDVNKDGREFVF